MAVLVGSTGYVGGHLAERHQFDLAVHRPTLHKLEGVTTDLLVIAGLPADKWWINQHPEEDWANTTQLAGALAKLRTERAVLISTIDVYQPPVGVNESSHANFDGPHAYGRNRAWFESFARATFPKSSIIRLPGLYSPNLRKNLIYDLLNNREDQLQQVNPHSTFQFCDATKIWNLVEICIKEQIDVLNVCSEPVEAADVAAVFGAVLSGTREPVHYDMRTHHSSLLNGPPNYLWSQGEILNGIASLRRDK